MKEHRFKITAYDIVIWIVIAAAITGTVFHISSHRLLVKSFFEFIDSCIYYGKSLFAKDKIPNDNVSFLVFDEQIAKSIIPADLDVFGYRFLATFELLVNGDFFIDSWNSFALFLNNLLIWIMLLVIPLILVLYLYYNFVLFKPNGKDATEESTCLRLYLKFKKVVLNPTWIFLTNLWYRFRYTTVYYAIAVILILYNVNMMSFALTFFAWYLYFIFSIDFISLYYLVCKFLICISPLLHPAVWPFWIIFSIWLMYRIKLSAGYAKLNEFYNKNDKFVGELGIINGIYGFPGAGKNLLEVAISTQKEVLLRRQACSDMMEIRLEFPDFPFRSLEEEIEDLRFTNKCVNKIQVKYHFIEKFKHKYVYYGYDLRENKSEHYDELKVRSLRDELLDYAQLYFIYISSLACSTYSLRYDKTVKLTGQFPAMGSDFFRRDFRNDEESERAKIFDLNLIRLLKQKDIDENNSITLFDFGVLTLSEFAKERGNRYTNQARKENDVRPSNDGTSQALGVLRHLTTVRYHQYGFAIWDDQKISSLSGVEASMAETNIFIDKQTSSTKLAVPLFFFEDVLIGWGNDYFSGKVDRYIHSRNDKTLYSYFVKRIAAFFANWKRKIINTFGYRRLSLSLSGVNINGAQERRGDQAFYLMHKIVFSDRYQTDCYSGFFDTLKLQAKKGINQMSSYSGIAATAQELMQQNGYFAGELITSLHEYFEENLRKEKKKKDDLKTNK